MPWCYVSRRWEITQCVAEAAEASSGRLGNASEGVMGALAADVSKMGITQCVAEGSGSLGQVGKCFRSRHQCSDVTSEDGSDSVPPEAASAFG